MDRWKQGSKRWSRWLLWWRTDPEEMRLQIDGYATLGVPRSARGFGLVVACACGLAQLRFAELCAVKISGQFEEYMSTPEGVVVLGSTGFALAAGVLLFPLGWLVYRGNEVAMGVVMALWTVFLALMNGLGWRSLPLVQDVMLFAVTLVAWAMCLHAFYTALGVERERTRAL